MLARRYGRFFETQIFADFFTDFLMQIVYGNIDDFSTIRQFKIQQLSRSAMNI